MCIYIYTYNNKYVDIYIYIHMMNECIYIYNSGQLRY